MQDRRKGVTTPILAEKSCSPVHCSAHYLNHCLQDAGRQIQLLRNNLGTVGETDRFTPKRSHLYSEN